MKPNRTYFKTARVIGYVELANNLNMCTFAIIVMVHLYLDQYAEEVQNSLIQSPFSMSYRHWMLSLILRLINTDNVCVLRC
jgi:hypothetical protein